MICCTASKKILWHMHPPIVNREISAECVASTVASHKLKHHMLVRTVINSINGAACMGRSVTQTPAHVLCCGRTLDDTPLPLQRSAIPYYVSNPQCKPVQRVSGQRKGVGRTTMYGIGEEEEPQIGTFHTSNCMIHLR